MIKHILVNASISCFKKDGFADILKTKESRGTNEIARLIVEMGGNASTVYQILYENAEPKQSLRKLFSRSLRNEFV